MANNFPVMAEMQVSALQYLVAIAPLAGPVNWLPASGYPLVSFQFGSDPGDGSPITFDYSAFDQDTHEAQVRTMLNAICGMLAQNLGVGPAAVQAAVTVQRLWTMTAAVQMMGTYPGSIFTDEMPYP